MHASMSDVFSDYWQANFVFSALLKTNPSEWEKQFQTDKPSKTIIGINQEGKFLATRRARPPWQPGRCPRRRCSKSRSSQRSSRWWSVSPASRQSRRNRKFHFHFVNFTRIIPVVRNYNETILLGLGGVILQWYWYIVCINDPSFSDILQILKTPFRIYLCSRHQRSFVAYEQESRFVSWKTIFKTKTTFEYAKNTQVPSSAYKLPSFPARIDRIER